MNNLENEIPERIEQIMKSISQIHGWLFQQGADNLYRLALKAPVANIVEIGSWKGKSASCLAYAIKDRGEGRVYAVDTWKGSPEHHEVLAEYKESQLYNEFIEKCN